MTKGEVIALIKALGGGGGGGSSGGALVVNLTIDTGTRNATADKTAAEIWAAAQSGVVVFTGSDAYMEYGGTFARLLLDADNTDDGYIFSFGRAFDVLEAATGSDYPTGTMY